MLNNYDDSTVLITSTNPQYWLENLNQLKKDSVIFFLVGNETYEPKIFNSLNNLKTLRHVFLYNPPNEISRKALIGGILGNIWDSGLSHSEAEGSVYRDSRIAYSLKRKFRDINMKYSFSSLPQGYTNSFADKITNLVKIKEDYSLTSKISLSEIFKLKNTQMNFSFVGQSGNRRREIFLKCAEKFAGTEIHPLESGFGGNNKNSDYTYVHTLLSSKFTLIPPGAFNNSNHRYTESLICHSLPVILANNSIDPSKNDNWTNSLSFLRRYSVKSQMKYLEKINGETFEKYYSLASSNDFKKILDTKTLIYSLLGKIDHS